MCISTHPKGTGFTREQLLEVAPMVVHDWMALKAFGKVDYGDEDRSDGARWNHLDYIKKVISFYMPNKRPQWCNGMGNPTKSKVVNDLMKPVLKLEMRRMGAKSRAKWPLSEKEFLLELQLMRKEGDAVHMYKYPCMSLWQFNFIGRIDDTCHHQLKDPRGHKRFDFALQSKV